MNELIERIRQNERMLASTGDPRDAQYELISLGSELTENVRRTMRDAMAALASPTPGGVVKQLEWNDNVAITEVGTYRVEPLDSKWEPLRNGYYMLPKRHGVVAAFDTPDEAKAYCQTDLDRRIRSALEAASSPAPGEAVAKPLVFIDSAGVLEALKRLLSLCETEGNPFDEAGRPTLAAARAAIANAERSPLPLGGWKQLDIPENATLEAESDEDGTIALRWLSRTKAEMLTLTARPDGRTLITKSALSPSPSSGDA